MKTNRILARIGILPLFTLVCFVPLKILIANLIRLEEKRTRTLRIKNAIFRRVRIAVRKVTYRHTRQSARNSAAPTEQVFVKFHIRHFHYSVSTVSVFLIKILL
jgi:hypothetical protein